MGGTTSCCEKRDEKVPARPASLEGKKLEGIE